MIKKETGFDIISVNYFYIEIQIKSSKGQINESYQNTVILISDGMMSDILI